MKRNELDETIKKIAKKFDADRVTLTISFKDKRKVKHKVFQYFVTNMKESKNEK